MVWHPPTLMVRHHGLPLDSVRCDTSSCARLQEHEGAKRRGGLRPAGLQRLVAALLRLRLDPAAAPLACELQVG